MLIVDLFVSLSLCLVLPPSHSNYLCVLSRLSCKIKRRLKAIEPQSPKPYECTPEYCVMGSGCLMMGFALLMDKNRFR